MTHTPERLDGISRQLGPLLSAQELQQDGDALRGGLADVEREALAERSLLKNDSTFKEEEEGENYPNLETARAHAAKIASELAKETGYEG